MTTTPNPISYNDIKRLAGDVTPEPTPTLNQRLTTLETAYDTSTEATANRLKEHTETLKEANRRANWQDQRIADLSDKLRTTQICLTLVFAGIIILATVISSFFR